MKYISNSSAALWQTCRRRWHLDRLGIYPVRESVAAKRGTYVHAGLAAVARGLSPAGAIADLCSAECARLDAIDDGDTADALTDTREAAALAEDVCARYMDHWRGDAAKWTDEAVEESFCVRVADERGRYIYGVRQVGRMDRRRRDRQTGRLACWEHKAPRERVAADYVRNRTHDMQPIGYVVALRELTGEPVDVCVYDVMRQAVPKVPKVTQKGILSRAACDTTAAVYRAALARTGEAEADHAETLAALDAADAAGTWFSRTTWAVSDAEVLRWRRWFAAVAREYGRPPYVPTFGACNIRGRLCPYRTWCAVDATPERPCHGYYVRPPESEMPRELRDSEEE